MVRTKSTENELDGESERDRRDGNPVTDQHANVTIHSDVAGYRHLWLESAL